MKYLPLAAAVVATLISPFVATPPVYAADVGLSLSIGQPGFYGHLDIGDFPQPQVVYSKPRVMYREALNRTPVYLHVPLSHAKNWPRYCRQYNACYERVYFVQDYWYQREYVPHYQKRHDDRRGDRQDRRGNDRIDLRLDNDPGRGHDQGRDGHR